jgi:signal transduction histidine kinase
VTTTRHTILIVDDESDVVRSVKDLLRLDYRVLGATRGEDAIRMMEEEEIHVVMSDQRMPNMSGVELLGRVRGRYPDAIRLLFTGYADMKAVIDAINTGHVYRYITKPWDPDELQAVIRDACEHFDLLVQRRELTDALRAKNAELERVNDELREANELKTAFIQVASHELRTPLTILTGLTNLAARAPDAPPPLRDTVKRIDAAAGRMRQLVDQILTMLSCQRFELVLRRAPVDVADLCRQAAEDVRPFAERRGQQLATELSADVGVAPLDAAKVRDAVTHLLLNAVKFTPDGGRITLSADRTGSGGSGDGDAVRVRVADTGVGIDPKHLPLMFKPFFTGFDVSRHSSGTFEFGRQGLGLGLSVVKAFVEMQGGTVTVESTPGKGATFTVTLPAGG